MSPSSERLGVASHPRNALDRRFRTLLNGRIGRLNEYRTTLSARPGREGTGPGRTGSARDCSRWASMTSGSWSAGPPRTLEAVLPIATEHFAFGDDAHKDRRRIGDIARRGGQPVSGLLVGTDANAQRRKSCRSTASWACRGDLPFPDWLQEWVLPSTSLSAMRRCRCRFAAPRVRMWRLRKRRPRLLQHE
jgi:hypothetical protein